MIVHGIPGPYKLQRGDIISIDIGVTLDGWVADAARTFPVGPDRRRSPRGCSTATEESLHPAPPQCVPGNRVGDISTPIQEVRRGLPACRSCARSSATAWDATCTRTPRSPITARPAGVCCWRRGWCSRSSRWPPPGRRGCGSADDNWAINTEDGSLAAHFEFTVAITAEGPRVLTPWHLPPQERSGGRWPKARQRELRRTRSARPVATIWGRCPSARRGRRRRRIPVR